MSGFDPEFARELMADDPFGLLDVKPKAVPATVEERLLASFHEITEFVREQGREPSKQTTDIKERRLAVRLEAMAGNSEQYEALREFDELGILKPPVPPESIEEALEADPFGLLGGDDGFADSTDIFNLQHVPLASKTQTMPTRIARRQQCENFEEYEPLFKQVHDELRAGRRKLVAFKNEQQIHPETFYVLNGIVAYVRAVGERTKSATGKVNASLHMIFENGQESNMLLRSLATELYKGNGKRITEPNAETLERMGLAPNTRMGSVYVLRTLSANPQLARFRHLHKIGHTIQTVEMRTAAAARNATFLNAPVEIIAEYELPAVAAPGVEAMLHTFFVAVRLDIWFERHGIAVADANEWFDVPLPVIDQAIELIQAETIGNYIYDADAQRITLAS